jgi:hypothetical protein
MEYLLAVKREDEPVAGVICRGKVLGGHVNRN